jgi:hypothetical protein
MIEISLVEHERQLAQRKAEVGDIVIPANDGSHRNPEKRAALQAIHDHARSQGREPRFKANFVRLD